MTRFAFPALALLLVACQKHPEAAPAQAVPIVAPPPAAHGGLKWTDPSAWKREPPKNAMRQAQYLVPKAAGDADDAELVVFYFGPGQGGSVDDNLARWESQFRLADGQPANAAAKVEKRKAGTVPVSVVQVQGTYAGNGMPGGPAEPKEHWALLGAIAETPDGPWFFKLTGPAATVTAARTQFDALVASLRLE